ncbi:MAG: hypothetical protein IT517_19510 [Burkholderiales bacterium]|nr:hypothetical protein [Burkholderiales bacterium]
MHCPHCRHDNAATTRFCTSCGAVLVESTSDGRRRRVLRPWGLARSAPATVSPGLSEIEAMRDGARPLSRRLDLRFAAGVAVIALAGTFLYPYARGLDLAVEEVERVTPADPVEVTTTSSHAVRETVVAAPPLVEPVHPPVKTLVTVSPRVTPPREAPAPLPPVRVQPVETPPVAIEPPPAVVIAAPAPPPVKRDRWQPLKDALALCGTRPGLWERATCEQGARIAHCDGAWGDTELCPPGRTEYGQ